MAPASLGQPVLYLGLAQAGPGGPLVPPVLQDLPHLVAGLGQPRHSDAELGRQPGGGRAA